MSKYAYISTKNDLSTQKSMLRKSITAFNNRFNNKYAMSFDTLSPKTVLKLYLMQFSDRMTGKCIKTRAEADAILMAYMSANTRFKNVRKNLSVISMTMRFQNVTEKIHLRANTQYF